MTARTDDYDQIVRIVKLYIDGFNDNDIRKFKEAFHKTPGSSSSMPKAPYRESDLCSSENWAAPPRKSIEGRIVSVTQVGDAASVHLSFKGSSDEWLDFHNLLRINGVWKITNKTATHSSR